MADSVPGRDGVLQSSTSTASPSSSTGGEDAGGGNFISVRGKICLVTGASSGLGKATAIRLAKEGCHVVLAARRMDRLKEVCEEIEGLPGEGRRQPGKARAVTLDVTAGEDEIDKSVEEAWQAFGRIDVLSHNAGVAGPVRSSLELKQSEWERAMNTNARGTWLVSRAVARRMVRAGMRGCIINNASIAGIERGLHLNIAHYAASKAAVIQLTKAMGNELGPDGIRVNAIAPGLFESEITQDLFKKDWISKAAERLVPLKRWGVADPDFTSAVVFLASDAASYITAATIIVDGGYSMVRPRMRSTL